MALDCARLLTKSVAQLAASDVTDEALEALQRSAVRQVLLLGRRSPLPRARHSGSTSERREKDERMSRSIHIYLHFLGKDKDAGGEISELTVVQQKSVLGVHSGGRSMRANLSAGF